MLKKFDEQLEKLKKRLIKMGSLVEEQFNLSTNAIFEESTEFCEQVFELEKLVDKIDFKIEKDCQKLFALNQPVALDLRLVISAINLSTDLERIGDISVNIAELFLKTKKKPIFLDKIKYREMVNEASQMLKNSLDAFIGNDVEKAKLVIISDKQLDDLNHINDQLLIDIMKSDPTCIDHAVHFLDICHQIERCGDHSTNIAEDVYFIAEADIIKHKYEKYIFTDEDNIEDEEDKD